MNRIFNYLFVAGSAIALSACVVINEDNNDNGGGSSSTTTGASGVATNRPAQDLTAQETQSFCEWGSSEASKRAGETLDCGDGLEFTWQGATVAECETFLSENPACDVGALEACYTVLFDDPCLIFSETAPAQCAALDDCVVGEVVDENNDGNNSGNNSTNTFCYDHDCNGDATGEQCFSTQEAYCDSLCQETNCISVVACENECF